MEAGCFIPGLRRNISEACRRAALTCEGAGDDLENLRNGADRNNRTYGETENGAFIPVGRPVTYRLEEPMRPTLIHIVFDSDLDRKTLPGSPFERTHSMRCNILPKTTPMRLPTTLPRRFTVTAKTPEGREIVLYSADENRKPVINLTPETVVSELSLRVEEVWYSAPKRAHLFSFDFR